MSTVAVITGGLLRNQDRWQLHPELTPWQSLLLRRRQRWFNAAIHNPLSVVSAIMDLPTVRLFVDTTTIRDCQYWVVTPWHGRAIRDRVQLLPEAQLDWQSQDAVWLQQQLQPLLDDLNMQLLIHPSGAMVMACTHPLHTQPLSYPHLEQEGLTNHHPEGEDGGKLMRLLAEIQMLLHQHQAPHRAGKAAVHGIWLWGAWQDDGASNSPLLPTIACRDTLLQQMCDGRDAQWMIGRSEEIIQMLPDNETMPAMVVLTGEGRAVSLTGHRWLSFGSKPLHETKLLAEECELWRQLYNR